jgi:type IV pilus assembly protein PilW
MKRVLQTPRQTGLSLVELLVAMTLGLVVSAVVFTVFINSRQAYRAQDGTALMQDNARYALETLARAIREAGYFGGADNSAFRWFPAGLDNRGADACSNAWIADARTALRGYAGDDESPVAAPCVLASYVPDSDVLVIRNANPNSWPQTGYIPIAEPLPNTNLFFISIPRGLGIIFDPAEVVAARTAASGQDDLNGVFTYRFQTRVFSIAEPPDPMMGTTLYNYSPHHGAPASQPVVDGVEMMRLAYGVDTDNDRAVDTWLRADQIDANPAMWDRVLAVRVGIVVRGQSLDEFNDDRTYTMPGGYVYTPPEDARRFPRRLYVQDVHIRNRSRN